tara:strand:+ start:60 stop:791 length:732 start_codon:yes stop_codon:yes gene_type:complete
MKTLIIIPSRMSATRLPGKPLLEINGLSVVSHVAKRAEESNIGEVIVATEDQEIMDDVKKNGFNAILTSNTHKTGTDRVYEAFKKSNIKNVDLIMNLQGDEPAINIEDIIDLNKKMIKNNSNLGTLAAVIKDSNDLKNVNIVKVTTEKNLRGNNFPKAVSFSRNSVNKENIYHHIGIFYYSTDTLEKFIRLDQSKNEINHRLEQLRALDNNIDINVSLAKSSPIGVDTMEDYLAVKKIMEYNN